MTDQEYDDSFASDHSSDRENQPVNPSKQLDKSWLNCQFHDEEHTQIKKPDEIQNEIEDPSFDLDEELFDRIQGSMFGMALGDALGAHVEFRPRQFLVDKPVTDLEGGGTWGLDKGQFTDDTSMALCLANSLIYCEGFNTYDQLVRYHWWYKHGYMSATGTCFDIGSATKKALKEFARRQKTFAQENEIPRDQLDFLQDQNLLDKFKVNCSEDGVAGNGALMRLAPVPLFFHKDPVRAVEYSGISGQITHGDQKAYDACQYYGALIVAALQGESKEQLLDPDFYRNHQPWFSNEELHPDVLKISQGSFKKAGGYEDGIRGKGYIIDALEAALWAFWSDEDSFEKGALQAVNLGDDTDTTAAIYGQLAGVYYGYKNLPEKWIKQVYAGKFLRIICKWITFLSQRQRIPSIPGIKITTVPDLVDDDSSISSDLASTNNDQSTTNTTSHVDLKQEDQDQQPQDATSIHSEHIEHNDNKTNDLKEEQDLTSNNSEQKKQDYQDYNDKTNDSEEYQDTISDSFEQREANPYNDNKTNYLFNEEIANHQTQEDRFETRSFIPVESSTTSRSVNIPITVTKETGNHQQYSQANQTKSPSGIFQIERIDDDRGKGRHQSSAYTQYSSNKMLMSWTVADVCLWVQSFGQEYTAYLDSFRKDRTDGFRLYNFINDGVLREFGVQNQKHRQTILDGIQQLRQKCRDQPRSYMYNSN